VPRKFLEKGVDVAVLSVFEKSVEKFKSLGHEVVDIELPTLHFGLPVYYVIMPAEASTNLSRFDGVKFGLHKDGGNLLGDYLETRSQGFGTEVRRRILLGAYVLSSGYYDAYYNKATAVREMLKKDLENAFKTVDVILTPTAPSPAFKIGEKTADPVSMYLEDIFTVPANLAGIPAISLPAGIKEEGGARLPIGIQLMANYANDFILFSLGKEFLNER
jgi:aspartyl-tRNA(Asn)/glutamyl-tRNA(Gln) amidotransferase subunit A